MREIDLCDKLFRFRPFIFFFLFSIFASWSNSSSSGPDQHKRIEIERMVTPYRDIFRAVPEQFPNIWWWWWVLLTYVLLCLIHVTNQKKKIKRCVLVGKRRKGNRNRTKRGGRRQQLPKLAFVTANQTLIFFFTVGRRSFATIVGKKCCYMFTF